MVIHGNSISGVFFWVNNGYHPRKNKNKNWANHHISLKSSASDGDDSRLHDGHDVMSRQQNSFCHPQIDGKVIITIEVVGIYFSIYLGMTIYIYIS